MTRARVLLLLLAAALALLPLSGSGQAGCRPIVSHHRQQLVVGYTPVYQPPQTYYVGQQLQMNAQEDRLAQKTAKLVLEQLRAQALQAPAEQVPAEPERMPLTAEVDRWALVKKNCAGCHSTSEKAMASVDMTDLSALDCETKLAMIAACLDNKMPPKKPLAADALGQLLGEIAGAETVQK